MNSNKIIPGLLAAFAFCFILFSCSNKDDELLLPQADIHMTMPVENSVVRFEETLVIKGTATSSQELHGYEIGIRKVGGSDLYFQHYHGHGNTINIEENWKNTLNETSDMEVVIDVIIDHEQHKQTKVIKFKIQN